MSTHLERAQKACAVLRRFLFYRGLGLVVEPLRPDHVAEADLVDGFTPGDSVKSILDTVYRWEILAARRDAAGALTGDLTFIVVLTSQSSEAHKAKHLESLLTQADGNARRMAGLRGIRDPRLTEVVVIAPDDLVAKKPLNEVFASVRAAVPAVRFGFYPFMKFSAVVPEVAIVPRHTVASAEEADAYLRANHVTRAQLPAILADDAAVIWAGAVRGQVVKVMRPSTTVGAFVPVYRYVR